MGFLERLISDVVRDNTGIDPRRLMRMVGGKNLLMLGAGAALAGGAALAVERGRSDKPQMPPPMPLGAGTAPPPNLPPLPPPLPRADDAEEEQDRTSGEESDASPDVSEAIIRVMVAAGLADGRLAESEREKIRARLIESNLSDEQIERINLELIVPASLDSLTTVPVVRSSSELREVLYRCAAATVLVDGHASEVERDWLDRLAAGLGLEPEQHQALEEELFTKEL